MDLKAIEITKDVLAEVPARIASHYTVFPAGIQNERLILLVPEHFDRNKKEELQVMLGRSIDWKPVIEAEIRRLIRQHYGMGAGAIDSLLQHHETEGTEAPRFLIDGNRGVDESTMIGVVNELIRHAVEAGASDIHIEPFETKFRIRYRVDGYLREARVPEQIRLLAPALISRVKVMAGLDIAEKRLPQDGRIKIFHQKDEIDLRVSVIPSSYGEAIVIRILKPLALLELSDLGFFEEDIQILKNALQKPHGLILLTGPTGSGKTTTLYACLKLLNDHEKKIITIEDPVEYKLDGVLQMQVAPKIGLDFAKALRAILRHDPDVIMLGEIRDKETADMATRAALTGHLVLSTLHTNDAPSAVTRLCEMGVEPYLVAASVNTVIAQRLVRKAGVSTKTEDNGIEFTGRLAIYEMMHVDDVLRERVASGEPATALRSYLRKQGMRSLYENGLLRLHAGETTQYEITRAVPQ